MTPITIPTSILVEILRLDLTYDDLFGSDGSPMVAAMAALRDRGLLPGLNLSQVKDATRQLVADVAAGRASIIAPQ